MSFKGRTYWLIGASEGLGRALARELDRRGATLVLSARSGDRLETLCEELTSKARIVTVDVTDADSVKEAWRNVGPVEGLVYLPALYEPMSAQEWNAERVQAMCDVNFNGAVRVLGQAAPAFVSRGNGHLVLIGSLAGYRGLPGAIGYASSKAALMHLAESMHADLWRTPVQVQLINPGFIRTRLTEKNNFEMPFIMSPEAAAKRTADAMETRRFKTDFPWGFSLVFRLSRLLPTRIYNALFARGRSDETGFRQPETG